MACNSVMASKNFYLLFFFFGFYRNMNLKSFEMVALEAIPQHPTPRFFLLSCSITELTLWHIELCVCVWFHSWWRAEVRAFAHAHRAPLCMCLPANTGLSSLMLVDSDLLEVMTVATNLSHTGIYGNHTQENKTTHAFLSISTIYIFLP